MTKHLFEQTLRELLHNEPFIPFVVELETGEQIQIAEPTLAFSNGFAGYLSPEYEIIDFRCENVRDIRPLPKEPVS
jgi:hypothetical protein